jgi:ribonuclease HI
MREWVHGWASRGWTRKTGPIENLELWHDAIRSVSEHQVEWRWVRGHAGHPQNEYANHLATRAAADQTSSSGLLDSAFDEWLAGQRSRGKMASELAPFPDVDAFRAGRPLPRV